MPASKNILAQVCSSVAGAYAFLHDHGFHGYKEDQDEEAHDYDAGIATHIASVFAYLPVASYDGSKRDG